MVVQIKEGGTGQTTAAGAAIALGLGGGPFLSIADAEATYLKITDAAAEYLTQADATTTYLTIANAASTYLPLTGGTLSGNFNLDADMMIRGPAGTSRFLAFNTLTSTRWLIGADTTAESGSNVGSDFAIYRYDDSNVFLGSPVYIQRSTGDVFLERHLDVAGTLQVDQDINASGDVNATGFTGNGAGLDSLSASELTTGTIPDARLPARIATAGQYVFPATQASSADPNTLDDYEENTWTVGIAFGGASVGVTYGTRIATYTKIGRLVFVNWDMTLTSNGTSTGAVTLTGLPFTVATVTASACIGYYAATVGLTSPLMGFASGTSITLAHGGATTIGGLTEGNIGDTFRCIGSMVYITAT